MDPTLFQFIVIIGIVLNLALTGILVLRGRP